MQHEFGEAKRITLTRDGNLILDRKSLEEELETITKYKEKKRKEILLKIKERIHTDYPFDEIKVDFMDKSYYKYIESRNWNNASKQILYKLKKEISNIQEILKRLNSIRIYLELVERIEANLTEEHFMPKYIDKTLAKALETKFTRHSPQYSQNLMNEISMQIHNLKYISSQLISLFSSKGIFYFLNKTQIKLSEQFNDYYNKYGGDSLISSIIDLGLPGNTYKTEFIEQSCKSLYKLIEKSKIFDLINHLNEILSDLKRIQRIVS